MVTLYRHQPGPRLSEAVVANGMIFLSGQVPTNLKDDIAAQTANVLAQIDACLSELGTDKSKIVDVTIFLADLADFIGMNGEWDRWVAPGNAPARATVQAQLANPDWKIEVKLVAVR